MHPHSSHSKRIGEVQKHDLRTPPKSGCSPHQFRNRMTGMSHKVGQQRRWKASSTDVLSRSRHSLPAALQDSTPVGTPRSFTNSASSSPAHDSPIGSPFTEQLRKKSSSLPSLKPLSNKSTSSTRSSLNPTAATRKQPVLSNSIEVPKRRSLQLQTRTESGNSSTTSIRSVKKGSEAGESPSENGPSTPLSAAGSSPRMLLREESRERVLEKIKELEGEKKAESSGVINTLTHKWASETYSQGPYAHITGGGGSAWKYAMNECADDIPETTKEDSPRSRNSSSSPVPAPLSMKEKPVLPAIGSSKASPVPENQQRSAEADDILERKMDQWRSDLPKLLADTTAEVEERQKMQKLLKEELAQDRKQAMQRAIAFSDELLKRSNVADSPHSDSPNLLDVTETMRSVTPQIYSVEQAHAQTQTATSNEEMEQREEEESGATHTENREETQSIIEELKRLLRGARSEAKQATKEAMEKSTVWAKQKRALLEENKELIEKLQNLTAASRREMDLLRGQKTVDKVLDAQVRSTVTNEETDTEEEFNSIWTAITANDTFGPWVAKKLEADQELAKQIQTVLKQEVQFWKTECHTTQAKLLELIHLFDTNVTLDSWQHPHQQDSPEGDDIGDNDSDEDDVVDIPVIPPRKTKDGSKTDDMDDDDPKSDSMWGYGFIRYLLHAKHKTVLQEAVLAQQPIFDYIVRTTLGDNDVFSRKRRVTSGDKNIYALPITAKSIAESLETAASTAYVDSDPEDSDSETEQTSSRSKKPVMIGRGDCASEVLQWMKAIAPVDMVKALSEASSLSGVMNLPASFRGGLYTANQAVQGNLRVEEDPNEEGGMGGAGLSLWDSLQRFLAAYSMSILLHRLVYAHVFRRRKRVKRRRRLRKQRKRIVGPVLQTWGSLSLDRVMELATAALRRCEDRANAVATTINVLKGRRKEGREDSEADSKVIAKLIEEYKEEKRHRTAQAHVWGVLLRYLDSYRKVLNDPQTPRALRVKLSARPTDRDLDISIRSSPAVHMTNTTQRPSTQWRSRKKGDRSQVPALQLNMGADSTVLPPNSAREATNTRSSENFVTFSPEMSAMAPF